MLEKSRLGDSQRYALELGIFFDSICRQYNIKYSLFGDSLWGALKYKSFLKQSHQMSFIMSYKEYNTFLEKCRVHLEGTEYYLANNDTHPGIDKKITLLVKRSKVLLGEKRKKDELYYDFSIRIIPFFYSANNKIDYEKHVKQCLKYVNIVKARKPIKGLTEASNLIPRVKNAILAKKDRKKAYEKLQEVCTRYREVSKFVIIPWDKWKYKGSVIASKTYDELTELEIEGHKFLAVSCAEEWIKDYYEKDLMDLEEEYAINQMSVSGPEIARRVQLIELEMLIEIDRICRKHNIKYSLFAGTLLGAVRHQGFIPWDDDIDVCMLKEEYDRFLEVAEFELDSRKYFIRTQKTDKDCNLTFAQIKRNNTLYYRKARNNYNTHLGIFVDIFPLYNGTNNWIMHKIRHQLCKFTKTMLWAYMGASSERRIGYRSYYKLLSKVSNKVSYRWFDKLANMFKDNQSKRVCYLAMKRNPFNGIFSKRETYLDLIEVEFEGYKFWAPRRLHEYLSYVYSEDYMLLPDLENRIAKHTAEYIDIGDLYKF